MKTLLLLIALSITYLVSHSTRSRRPGNVKHATQANLNSDDTIKRTRVQNLEPVQYGVASYYHQKFNGKKTASGDLYDPKKFTAAHNSLPFNTWIKVTNLRNKRTVFVMVNDRLHHRNKRLVDLSRVAAVKLGYVGRGLEKVKVEVLGKERPEGM